MHEDHTREKNARKTTSYLNPAGNRAPPFKVRMFVVSYLEQQRDIAWRGWGRESLIFPFLRRQHVRKVLLRCLNSFCRRLHFPHWDHYGRKVSLAWKTQILTIHFKYGTDEAQRAEDIEDKFILMSTCLAFSHPPFPTPFNRLAQVY